MSALRRSLGQPGAHEFAVDIHAVRSSDVFARLIDLDRELSNFGH